MKNVTTEYIHTKHECACDNASSLENAIEKYT